MNMGEGPARMLILVTPGGIHEKFFEEMGRLAGNANGAPAVEQIVAIAAGYGIQILPPVVPRLDNVYRAAFTLKFDPAPGQRELAFQSQRLEHSDQLCH